MKRPQVLALPLSFAAHGVALAAVITLSVAPSELPRVTAASPTDAVPIPVFPSHRPSRPPREGGPSVPRRDPALVRPVAPPVVADPLLPGADDDLRIEVPAASRDGCIGCMPSSGAIGDADEGPGGGTPGAPPIGPVRVGGLIREPVKVRHVPPTYPEIARAARVQGTVVLECLLTLEGRVEGVRVVSGHPLLSPAATAAVGQWLYRPTLLNGVPVPVLMTVTVMFHMR